ncbi:MAG: HipA domain-containing protein [Clostridia bacterium]|nr:HipA domain-containing protein [Clostridia bacterium]
MKGYRLSPAYDLTTLPNKPEHEMSVNGKDKPTESDLLAIAKDFKLSPQRCQNIIEDIKIKLKLI